MYYLKYKTVIEFIEFSVLATVVLTYISSLVKWHSDRKEFLMQRNLNSVNHTSRQVPCVRTSYNLEHKFVLKLFCVEAKGRRALDMLRVHLMNTVCQHYCNTVGRCYIVHIHHILEGYVSNVLYKSLGILICIFINQITI